MKTVDLRPWARALWLKTGRWALTRVAEFEPISTIFWAPSAEFLADIGRS